MTGRGMVWWSVVLGAGFLAIGTLFASIAAMVTRVVPFPHCGTGGPSPTLELAYGGAFAHLFTRWPAALVAGLVLAPCLRRSARPFIVGMVAVSIPLLLEAWLLASTLAIYSHGMQEPATGWAWWEAMDLIARHPWMPEDLLRRVVYAGSSAILTGLVAARWTLDCRRRLDEHDAREPGERGGGTPDAWLRARVVPVVPQGLGRWTARAFGIGLVLAALVGIAHRGLTSNPAAAPPPDSTRTESVDPHAIDREALARQMDPRPSWIESLVNVVLGVLLIRWSVRRGRVAMRADSVVPSTG